MLSWFTPWAQPRGSSGRVCDTSMLIRSFAVTAAAAAFLVWRVFFQGREEPVPQASDEPSKEDSSARSGSGAAADRHGQPPSSPADSRQAATQSDLEPGTPLLKGVEQPEAARSLAASAKQDALLGPAPEGPTSPGVSTAGHDAGAGTVLDDSTSYQQLHPRASAVAEDMDNGTAEDAARRTLSSQLPAVQHVLTAVRQVAVTSPRSAAVHVATVHAAEEPKLHLQVLTGPAAPSTFSSLDRQVLTVRIGRVANCELCINDQEVSGRHAVITFSEEQRCWYLADLGSLNGTLLNSRVISREGRLRSDQFQLADHDIVQLGTNTQIRVRCQPSPSRQSDTGSPTAGQLLGSNARHLSPRQQAAAATLPSTAVHPALRAAAATLTRTGLLHVRHGSACEDVAVWQLPFPAAHLPAIGTTVDASFLQLAAAAADTGGNGSSSSSSRVAGLFCVFDGHGGGACSAEARTVVPAALAQEFGGLQPMLLPSVGGEATRQDVWERAYLAADATLSCDEGCTASTVLVERREDGRVVVQAANVGDSTAILVCMHGDRRAFPAAPPTITQLTAEHKVAEERENARLRARGFQGKTRLYGLALSRSLGDKFLKEQDVGLLAVPHVSPALSIAPEEEAVVVVASDGLWDVVSCEAAGNAAVRILHGANGSAAAVAEGLMQMALLGRSQDDITVMAVHIQRAAEQ